MRILILSDLHHDFWADKDAHRQQLIAGLRRTGRVDAAILAGDVANKARTRWAAAAKDLDAIVDRAHTYIFPGNHDYYGHRIDREDRLQNWAQDIGWTWAQRTAPVLDGVRFLCATLWTDLALDRPPRENGAWLATRMNDYRAIRVERGGYRKLRPEDTGRIHHHHLHWLDAQLALPHPGPTAVVTHHAPHPCVLDQRHGGYDAAYASDLETFLRRHQGPTPRSWFFGHSHEAKAADLHGWRLRPHSLGYPEEGADPIHTLPACVVETRDL